jgi:diaminopimelate decarboxylase
MVGFVKYIREKGFNLEYLDIGGGLGIDYLHDKESNENIPTPMDLINSIRDLVN